MSFRFRKSVRLFPGVRLNLSTSGMSVSVGGPGATVNFSSRGTALTLGIPGTGLSLRHQLSSRPPVEDAFPRSFAPSSRTVPDYAEPDFPQSLKAIAATEIRSAEVAVLTSPDLTGLKRLINDAAAQRTALMPDLAEATRARERAWRKLRRREQLPLRLFLKKSIPKARTAFDEAEQEAMKVAEAIALSRVCIEFVFDEDALQAQRELEAAHTVLSRCSRIWDVTAEVAVDRVKARSVASKAVDRSLVQLSSITEGLVVGDQKGLRFQNTNGSDLDIFPGFMLMHARESSDYALVDLRELLLEFEAIRFIEDGPVPADTEIIGQAWERSNKDGSRDRRFNNNRQIPIVRYGELRFQTAAGVAEAYQASNSEAAAAFYRAFRNIQDSLRRQAARPLASNVPALRPVQANEVSVMLPGLPNVWGAHEVTAFAAIAVFGPLFAIGLPGQGRLSSSADSAASQATDIAGQSQTPLGPVSFSPLGQTASAIPTVPQPLVSGLPAPVIVRTPVGAMPLRERVATTQAVNMRSGPDLRAKPIRVVPMNTPFNIFERQDIWVQVGETAPMGWIHSSFLKPAARNGKLLR